MSVAPLLPPEPTHSTAAILVAAGSGRRMGFDKILAPLCGRPVLLWSVEAFQSCSEISVVAVVCPPGREDEFAALCAGFSKVGPIVPGGGERRDSVRNGLDAIASRIPPPDFVAVHDAARPLVTPGMVTGVVRAAWHSGASVAAEPVSDTLHRVASDGLLESTVSRENLWAMQTPQVARIGWLQSALASALADGRPVTDEMSALLETGHRPVPFAHAETNFKITYPRDLELAAAILDERARRARFSVDSDMKPATLPTQ